MEFRKKCMSVFRLQLNQMELISSRLVNRIESLATHEQNLPGRNGATSLHSGPAHRARRYFVAFVLNTRLTHVNITYIRYLRILYA